MDGTMENAVDNSQERPKSECFSDNDDTFGDQQLLPRVGDEYQVEIPELMMEYVGWGGKPTDVMPIPIMWVHGETEAIQKETLEDHGNHNSAVNEHGFVESESSQESQITSNDEAVQFRAEPLATDVENVEELGRKVSMIQPLFNSDNMDSYFTLPEEKETNSDHENNSCLPLPFSKADTWNDIEHDSFLLGLYIFGKNLRLVQKFVETRKMGEILSNYYGKFYRSSEYLRWSQSRKMKAKRCIQGEKIFTGWRQNELLSRISSHASEENKNMLIEVSKDFGDGKLTLEDYVFGLKKMVGVSVLVQAVGIGKGKRDLTGTANDRAKTRNVIPICPEIPSGSACSTLTKGEIIKFLTGDFRISKARSNDLFWEAVWPRLLARGWHSEQPTDHSSALKYSLVFLVPGVKKFSRAKHVKGSHYFDSVSDVLKKVAAEPEHLELESEAVEVNAEPGHLEVEPEAVEVSTDKEESSSESDSLSNKQTHCYLQPRKSNVKNNVGKFTIVDTSLVCGENGVKFRELRSLPVDVISMHSSALSKGTARGNTKKSQNEIEVKNTSKLVENITEHGALTASTGRIISPNGPDIMIKAEETQKDQRTSLPNDKQSSKALKFQFTRKGKSHKSRSLEPVTEVSGCKHGESSHGVENIFVDRESSHGVENICVDPNLDEEEPCRLSSPDRSEIKDFLQKAFQNPSSVHSVPCIPEESKRVVSPNTIHTASEMIHPQISIDLNLPHMPPETFLDESVIKNDYPFTNNLSLVSETTDRPELLNPSSNGSVMERHPVVIGRRQSTRNRPMTTKALEAFAFEGCSPKKKRRGIYAMSKTNFESNSFRRVSRVGGTPPFDVAGEDVAYYEVEERGNGATNMDDNFLH